MKFKKWKKLKSKLKKTFFAISYWYKKKTISVKNSEDTLHEIINSQRSLCRYGDGEFHCIVGEDFGDADHLTVAGAQKLPTKLKRLL